MNWGWGVILIFAAFITMMAYFFLRAMTVDLNMVREDYYKEEADINRTSQLNSNYESLGKKVRLEFNNESSILRLEFPNKLESGSVWIYRPSSSKLDQRYALPVDQDSVISIKTQALLPGFWRVKLEWVSKGIGYSAEEALQVD